MKIPRKLLELAYKKIKDNFDILKDFLDMVKYFEPETTDENLKEAYTAWSYSEKSIGDGIYKLNKIIWDYFNIDGVKNIWEFFTASTPNIKQNFKEIVINTIGENYNKFNLLPQYISENFEEKCKICDKEKVDYYCYDFEYELSGMIITSVNHSIRLSSGSYSYYSHKINISLQSFFNDIFQILFTKLIDYEIRDKKISLEWVK